VNTHTHTVRDDTDDPTHASASAGVATGLVGTSSAYRLVYKHASGDFDVWSFRDKCVDIGAESIPFARGQHGDRPSVISRRHFGMLWW